MTTPSQVTSSKAQQKSCRLFRLQMLIIDGGLLILRNIFDQKLQNVPLVAFLKNERQTFTNLRTRGILTQVQYDLVFPSGGTAPTSTDLDITLIICLLRNIKSFGLNKKFQWNSIPAQGDTSVEADISRLKMYRNELSHISSTSGITLPIFTTKWTEIEQVLLRLNTAVSPIPDLQKMIDDLKVNPLDPQAEIRVQKAIDSWQMLEKGVEADLKLLKMEDEKIKHTLNVQGQTVRKAERRVQKAIDSWQMLEKGVEADLKLMKMEDEKIKYTLNVQGKTVRKHAQSICELNKKTSEHDKQIQELKEETRKDVTAETKSMRQSQYEESKK
ncbi:uncharacterized protein LOC132717215, partial [Ruditapes philippinarum]|uniref:uncharacterized protein LOC132717215 n=1 Tax=Ruditapes philippinarum TaxID=129788 RepID=UPI00295A5F30